MNSSAQARWLKTIEVFDEQGEALVSGYPKPANEVTTDLGPPISLPTGNRDRVTSACEPYRELLEQGLGRGRNAMAIWQDLVSDHGVPHGYQTVKRFVHKLPGSTQPQAVGIIHTAAGEEAQADYGSDPMVRDAQSGKYRRTRLFVLTLGYSRKSVRLLVKCRCARLRFRDSPRQRIRTPEWWL